MSPAKKVGTSHIRIKNDDVRGDHVFVCEHCRTEQRIALPMQIDLWLKVAKAFEQQHKHCQPPY